MLGHGTVGPVPPGQAAGCHLGTDSRECVEGRYATAASAEAFGEGALRNEFDFQLTDEVPAGEFLLLSDVGAGHAGDAALDQPPPDRVRRVRGEPG